MHVFMHAYINQPANVLLFSQLRKFLLLFFAYLQIFFGNFGFL